MSVRLVKQTGSGGGGGTVSVREGALLFTDPRVGGVLDDGTVDNGAVTAGFSDGLSAVDRATVLLRTGGPGGELHIGNGGLANLGTTKPLLIPNNCTLTGETSDKGTSTTPAFDGSNPPFRYGSVIRALAGFNGGTNACVVQIGEDFDATAVGKRHSGAVGAAMRGITVDANQLAFYPVRVIGHRAEVRSSGIHRGKTTGSSLRVDGQGAIVEGNWIGNSNAGNGIEQQGFDLHVLNNRISNCAIGILSVTGSIYVAALNHIFTTPDEGSALVSGSRDIVLQGSGYAHITTNIIENTALEQILVQPAAGKVMEGVHIISNTFYNQASTYIADSTAIVKIDATAAGAAVHNFTLRSNGMANKFRPLALVNCVAGSTIEEWSVAGNDALLAKSVFAPASMLPDGDVAGNVIRTGAGVVKRSHRRAVTTQNSDGTTTVVIPHNLGTYPTQVPRYWQVQAGNAAAATAGVRYATIDDTNLSVILTTAPANGTPLAFSWEVEL